MKNTLENHTGRPGRYDQNDGTGEMVIGLMALGFAFLDFLQAVLPEDSMWRHGFANTALFFAVLLLMLGLMHWVPRAIKQRYVWPRTGYVAYRVGGKSFWIVMIAVAVFSAVIAAGVGFLMRSPHSGPAGQAGGGDMPPDWMRLGWMGTVATYVAMYAWFTYLTGRGHPWKWLVLLFMALGLLAIALIAPAGFAGRWRPMLWFIGLAWLASGGITLYLYIRHTPLPAPEAE